MAAPRSLKYATLAVAFLFAVCVALSLRLPQHTTFNGEVVTFTYHALNRLLYYGEVSRHVQERNGTIIMRTEGTGNGGFASLNELFSVSLWRKVDQNIAEEF